MEAEKKWVRHFKNYDSCNDREIHRLDVTINGEMLVVHVPIDLPASAADIAEKISESFEALVARAGTLYELKMAPTESYT